VSEDLDLDLLSLYLKGESRLDLFEAVATGASVERQTELRKYSKVNTDGRIQPGLLAEKDGRNRRFDERDTPSPLDSEDEFIDDPYFGRRIKTYGGGLRLGNKRIDNREKILREKSELKRKRQLEKMSRSSQRLPTRGGVSRMLPERDIFSSCLFRFSSDFSRNIFSLLSILLFPNLNPPP
jgi:hypothetical protein